MAVIHQEGDAVLLRRDGVHLGPMYDPQVLHAQLVADGGPGVGTDLAAHDDGRLLGQLPATLEELRGHIALEDDALDDAGAVADLQEVELAAGATVVDPAAQLHALALPGRDLGDPGRGQLLPFRTVLTHRASSSPLNRKTTDAEGSPASFGSLPSRAVGAESSRLNSSAASPCG